MKNPVVFTDLDGTLLEHHTYSFEAALPALRLLREKGIPLIICSSKTRKEIERYRQKLDNHHPFISENGGGIFIPENYFGFKIADMGVKTEEGTEYQILRLGANYADLRKAILELRAEGYNVRGFGDMRADELAGIAGLSLDEARMAMERDFDEPFIFEGDGRDISRLIVAVSAKGFNLTRGRFLHILGDSDKGRAVSVLIKLFRREMDEVVSIALGDSPNDIPMLEAVDYPVVVRKPDGKYDPDINVQGLARAEGIGPEGWNKAVIDLLTGSSAVI